MANIDHLLSRSDFNFILHDVTRPFFVNAEEIFNFACPASPVQYQTDPIHTMKTCVLGSLNALEIAKRKNAKILQASTSEVYGNPSSHPQPETYLGSVNPIGVRACYDEGKRAAEALFFDYHRKHEVQIKVARIFNTYGPRMHPDDGRVVSNFIVQALRGEPITIYGDGSQTRAFCYIDDLTEALVRLMHSPDAFLGPVNLGNSAEVTILELADMILALTGSKSRLVLHPLPADDPVRRRPDLTRAERELGWRPQVPLREGLLRTVDYFDSCFITQPRPMVERAACISRVGEAGPARLRTV
jgi:UDP-glucuronate decarboxylase